MSMISDEMEAERAKIERRLTEIARIERDNSIEASQRMIKRLNTELDVVNLFQPRTYRQGQARDAVAVAITHLQFYVEELQKRNASESGLQHPIPIPYTDGDPL